MKLKRHSRSRAWFRFLFAASIPALGCATRAVEGLPIPTPGTPANRGYKLYSMNCAHCHGSDARGDEGPDLHGVLKSDVKIAGMIKNGIKGEMPKFSAKLQDAEVNDLVAFIRTLKDD